MSQSRQPFHVRESSSARLTATIKDETETAIPAASIDTLTLELYDQRTHLDSPGSTAAIINGRAGQDILNANGCVVDSSGNLTLTLKPADNVIVNAGQSSERHVALLKWTYAAGLKAGMEEVLLDVVNYARTT